MTVNADSNTKRKRDIDDVSFSSKRRVIWLQSRRQTPVNSASELGIEMLRNTDYEIYRFDRFAIVTAAKVYLACRRGAVIYFQFGTPLENLMVSCLIAARQTVVAHYLDQIAEGYPAWARTIGLKTIVYYILRKSRLVVAISPKMKLDLINRRARKGKIIVGFRTIPDSGPAESHLDAQFRNKVIFAGNINRKTNYSALINAAQELEKRKLKLVVHTRTTNKKMLNGLSAAGADVQQEISSSRIVHHSFRFRAQLLPFNKDARSKRFYRASMPSKLPNLFMARRKIIYYGPSDFWLRDWLADQPGLMIDLESIDQALPSLSPLPPQTANDNLQRLVNLTNIINWDNL